ncbi:MAG: Crp/Fnr family transcriptional regulator [Epulopiscium sp.]|nr:Crp/Fnr family transcriptional regulator [Candidatus Epulonipiscium sp.]
MITTEDIQILSNSFTFWNHLSINEKNLVLNNINLVKYDQGENVHGGNQDCAGVLLVKSGILRIYILSEEGKEITLYRLYEGELCILSASCILQNITFDVHIDAEIESEILLLNSSAFAQLSQQNIYVENFSYKIAVDRFSDVMWAMQQILFMSFDKRLAIFLLDEISKNNSNTIRLTHEQIAKYMGSAREVVSRMLKYFSNEGIVELSRGGVKVLDKNKLRNLL